MSANQNKEIDNAKGVARMSPNQNKEVAKGTVVAKMSPNQKKRNRKWEGGRKNVS